MSVRVWFRYWTFRCVGCGRWCVPRLCFDCYWERVFGEEDRG